MSFAYNKNLKIEFRAVPYSTSHVLEYRISPNQDLTYETEVNIFGLFKIKLKRKYKTNWHQPTIITNYPSAYLYSKESGEIYLPFFIREKKDSIILSNNSSSFNSNISQKSKIPLGVTCSIPTISAIL